MPSYSVRPFLQSVVSFLLDFVPCCCPLLCLVNFGSMLDIVDEKL